MEVLTVKNPWAWVIIQKKGTKRRVRYNSRYPEKRADALGGAVRFREPSV
jgi:hypothetical protein